jgi:hypothetical protein
LTRLFRVPQNTKLAGNLALVLVHEYSLSSTLVSLLEMTREYQHIYSRPRTSTGRQFMNRHDAVPAQIATPPLRPAQYLAPLDDKIVITRPLRLLCRGKLQIKGPVIASRDLDMASPTPTAVSPPTGQIQKNP